MLYESDISQLLTRWEAGLDKQSPDYKIAVRDCIYDLRMLVDKQFQEEAMAAESFEQRLEEDKAFTRTWKIC